MKTISKPLYFDRERETFGLTRSEKITISPIKIDGNQMTHVTKMEKSSGKIVNIHVLYEKQTDDDLKMTQTIDDVISFRHFKKAAE